MASEAIKFHYSHW